MAGTYWLTVLPDTSKLKPAIEASMRGQKITADFGIDPAKAKKAGKDAADTAKKEADKSKPKVTPEADKPGAKKAGEHAAEEAAKPVRNKKPKITPAADLPGARKAGEQAGESAAGGMLTAVKRLAPMLGGLSILGGLKSSLTEGMAFTESLNVMQGVTSATGAQISQVSDLAKQLGTDVSLAGISANDAATAMTELAKGGMSVQESMDAVKGTLALASAAGLGAAEAATIQSDALNIFRISATESTRVADLLVNAANASSSEVPQMAQALAQAGSAAAGFGISIEDTLTSLALFSNFGIKGSDAGTLMKASLMAITDGGEPAQAAIKELGLTLYDANKQFVGYPAMLEQVAQASKNMSQEQFQAATAVLFGSDAMRGAMVAANGGAEEFGKTANEVVNGAGAIDMASTRMQGLPGAWGNFTNMLDGVKMSISEMVDGPLESLLRKLTGLPDFISRNADAFKIAAGVITTLLVPALVLWIKQQTIALALSAKQGVASLIMSWKMLSTMILNAALAMGTYVVAIGRAIAASILAGLSSMVTAFRNLAIGTRIAAAAQAAFNLVLMANPIGLIIAAVAALVAGLVWFFTKTELGQKIWKSFTDFLVLAWDKIKSAFATAWESIKTVFQGLLDKAGEVWEGIKTKFTAVVDFVKGLPGKISSAAKGMWDGIGNAFKSVVNGMIAVWNGFASRLSFTTPDWIPGIGGKKFSLPTIAALASGGYITGPGSGTSDSILARLSNGEYVINAAMTKRYLPLLEAINRGSLPGFAGGGLAASGKAPEGGLQGNSILVARLLSQMFPQIASIGGYRANGGGYADHPEGRAIDVMIPNYQSEGGIALGNAITAFLHENADKLNLDYTIWRQTYRSASGATNMMAAQGSDTLDHFDHVHATLKAGSPSSFAIPSGLRLPAGLTSSMDGQSIATSVGSVSGAGTYRAATASELSASSNRVSSANKAVTQAEQRVDDRTFDRDQAQSRLDARRAEGKDTTEAERSLFQAERELTDATEALKEKRDKAAAAEQEYTDLQTNGKLDTSAVSDSSDATAVGKQGMDGSSLGQTFVSGILESIGLDGSLFSNPLEWPTVKSAMAGVNWLGKLLSGEGTDAAATGTPGGFVSGAADAVGLGGLLSAIPSATSMASQSGSPVLAPGEFNPAVPGATAPAATGSMSAFAPHGGTGGAAPGPAVDNSININGPVGMSPDALQTKIRTEQNARTRTTVMR